MSTTTTYTEIEYLKKILFYKRQYDTAKTNFKPQNVLNAIQTEANKIRGKMGLVGYDYSAKRTLEMNALQLSNWIVELETSEKSALIYEIDKMVENIDIVKIDEKQLYEDVKVVINKDLEEAYNTMDGKVNSIDTLLDSSKEILTTVSTGLKEGLSTLFNLLANRFDDSMDIVKNDLKDVDIALKASRDESIETFKSIGTGIADTFGLLKDNLSTQYDTIKETISTDIGYVKEALSKDIFTNIKDVRDTMAVLKSKVDVGIDNSLKYVSDKFLETIEGIKETYSNIVEGSKDILAGLGETIDFLLSGLLDSITGLFTWDDNIFENFTSNMFKTIEKQRLNIVKSMSELESV